MGGRLVTAVDGPIGFTLEVESAGGALRASADEPSPRKCSVPGAAGVPADGLTVFAAAGVEFREFVSAGRLATAGEGASTARVDFWASRKRFPIGLRSIVSPTATPITASKDTYAATRSPDVSTT